MNSSDLLDELGTLGGTDKCSLCHDYLRHYERILWPLRDAPITIIEIGVDRGGSLRMWSKFFSRALLVGVDIRPECKQYERDGVIIEIGSQNDPDFLAMIGQKYNPTLVIDDGSHRADHVLTTFENLYPFVKAGGIYIVEDVHFHAGHQAPGYRGAATESPQDYFLRLGKLTCVHEEGVAFDHKLAAMTDGVEFFHGAIVLRKKPEANRKMLARRRILVERANRPELWNLFAAHLLDHDGDVTMAAEAARHAIELDPNEAIYHYRLSQALQRGGSTPAAIIAAERAVALHPQFELFSQHLADLISN